MILLDFLEALPLPLLFLVTIVCGLAAGTLVLVAVRVTVHLLGIAPTQSLPIRDALIGSLSAMFALMVAFSAAGIWSDAIQARGAVQREANSIENIVAIGWSFPKDFREDVHNEMLRYARRTIQRDWPAMRRRAGLNETLFDRSNSPLVALITRASEENSSGHSLPLSNALIEQIVELRAARLQREMIARGGISTAQWVVMILIALGAMTTIAIAHNHEGGLQITTLSVYAVGASSAFFVLLAHDRPFVGLSARKRFGHARSEFEFLASRQLEAKSAPAQARAPPFVNRWSLTQRLRFSGSKARQRSWRFPLLWLLVLVPAWP